MKILYRKLKAAWLNWRGDQWIACRDCGAGIPYVITEIEPSGTVIRTLTPCFHCLLELAERTDVYEPRHAKRLVNFIQGKPDGEWERVWPKPRENTDKA